MRVNYREVVRSYWNGQAEEYARTHPEHLESDLHPSWGLWHIPEEQLRIFGTESLVGKTILELGCGRGHDSAAYAKLGANVIALDVASNQLNQAPQHENLTLLEAAAHDIPLPNHTVDIVFSDHGAFDHTPAPLILAEVSRVLRTSGQLAICTYSPMSLSCYDRDTGRVTKSLVRPYPRSDVLFDGEIIGVEYSYSTWISLFKKFGFCVDRLEEIVVEEGATEYFGDLVDASWASNWPSDIIWSVYKR